ncbi:1-acyl-sn-glycerol-3-phosphate acyltransferase [Chamaesiphon sp.]|uniref:1-acyl-sn-glycerol-3-phosphate acyltransferase n=1 Tax=Chamaesiphon sp. TaxID=2814140 RepID=UPI0035930F51
MPPITKAQPQLAFLPPRFNVWVLRLVAWVLPYWLKSKLKIANIDVTDIDRLVEVYKQSQMGRLRLIIAFRHPSSDDSFCMGYLLTKLLPDAARKHRILLKSPVFAHFIYDRGIPLWAGKIVSWLYPRLGGIPIHRGRVDSAGLRTARELLVNGQMPLAIAPEGATNGHSELVSPLESGAAQLGFWAMEDLIAAGREEDVLIIPIGIQYYYVDEPWLRLEETIAQLEQDCGMSIDRHDSRVAIGQSDPRPMQKLLYDRFYRLSQYLLYQMENFYAQFYQYQIPERPPEAQTISRTEISQRLQSLLDFALQVSESYFNLQPRGTKIDRCRRIEQAGWNWIYLEELTIPTNMSPVSRKLADRIASEADLRMWHMRLVESFIAVTSSYVKDRPTIDRFAEITLLLWDLVAQIRGENAKRPQLGKRRVQMTICNPIPLSDYWDRYKSGRRQARQATLDLTQELQTSMEGTLDRGW